MVNNQHMDTPQADLEARHREPLTPQANAPAMPTAFDDLHIPIAVLENLLMKHLAASPKSDLIELTRLMGISSNLVERLVEVLKRKALVEAYQPDVAYSGQIRYGLSQQGMQEADTAFIKDAYLGPAPVSLQDYNEMVQRQDVRSNYVTRPDVTYALKDVMGAERLIPVLGPAINSGRALLLYGDAGTGKTYVATRILRSLGTSVYIPYAVYAAGNIIKLFSPQHHQPVAAETETLSAAIRHGHDKRWVLCERPSIQVGGELTMSMLEVNHSEHNKVWIAPLQMMANNGIFVIDDLGRQTMPVASLLNRWIVPMEYFYDYLSLPNGQQITVPFVLMLAFSSNLKPEKIADPAFLRRLGYKVEVHPLTLDEYRSLWEIMAGQRNLQLEELAFDRLLSLHRQHQVGFYPCLPKDLVGISHDILFFEEASPVITPQVIEQAWELYFTNDGTGGGRA